MYKVFVFLFFVLWINGCNGSDVDKATQETQKLIDKYKGNQAREIEDTENSQIPDDEDIQTMLELQNSARDEVGIGSEYDLRWSDNLASVAKNYANLLANSGEFKHDPSNRSNGYGENLYASYSSNGDVATFTDATRAWLDEKSDYSYARFKDGTNEGKKVGHYTQIVWKNTTKIGCARSRYKRGSYKGGYVIVCKYQTPGNVIGQFPY